MPSITNVGGSFTSAIILTLLAWAVRWVRSKAHNAPLVKKNSKQEEELSCGKYFSVLSPAAVKMLVETSPMLHLLIDIRQPSQAGRRSLPPELENAVKLPVTQIADALSSQTAWKERILATRGKTSKVEDDDDFPPQSPQTLPPLPHPETLLVFLADEQEDARAAAVAAASRGYQRTALVAGGLGAWDPEGAPMGAPRLSAPQLRYINRDAVSLLFGHVTDTTNSNFAAPMVSAPAANGPVSYMRAPRGLLRPPLPTAVGGSQAGRHLGPLLVDLRRHDERALYGSVAGAVHLPVDEFPSALELPDATFLQRYRFPKPALDAVMVLMCRTNQRSNWAAVVATECGYNRCFVYKQGTYGWRLSPDVRAYSAYAINEPPPQPEDVPLEHVDVAAARAELQQLHLVCKACVLTVSQCIGNTS